MNSYQTRISGEQQTIKRYYKNIRIMDVRRLVVGMHYVQKKLIRKNQNLPPNSRIFHFLTRSRTFLTACWLSIFMSTKSRESVLWIDRSEQRFQSSVGAFRKKLKTSMYVHFGLLCKFSDQIQNCSIQIKKVKNWKFSFQKNKYAY